MKTSIYYYHFIECWLIRRISKKHGVLEYLNKRALTHSVSKTGLHPLDRHDEGMIGRRPVETWEGKPPGAAWRMRAVYGNDWSLKYTPLFKFAFMLPIVSK
ncbi:hypothetical protein, partial [Mesobacillus zeae]|uniref:hypothetical protein n=1 Tax=Mesobacillus zeae TaxID=1917180 RepID=UPI001C7161F0